MRARNIKPGFFDNEELAECDPLARILFAGLWCMADREGRLEDRPKRIKAKVLPYDQCDISKLLQELIDAQFLQRYEVEGKQYIQIVNFAKHQKPHHMEHESVIPPPPGENNKFQAKPIYKKQRERIFERDGNKCVYCGEAGDLHLDHIIPVSKGGTSDDENLQVLCSSCNLKKGNSNTDRGQAEHESNTNRGQIVSKASCFTDSGFRIPDSHDSGSQSTEEDSPAGLTSQEKDPYVCCIPTQREDRPLRVKQSQADKWQQQFRFVDVYGELARLETWAGNLEPQKRWKADGAFMACSQAVNKANQREMRELHKKDPRFDPSDPYGDKAAEADWKATQERINKLAQSKAVGGNA
jgi:hypothetical protein